MNDKDSKLIQEAYQKIQEAQFTSSGIKKTWGSDKGSDTIEDYTINIDGIKYVVNSEYEKRHEYDSGTEIDPSYSEIYVTLIEPTITHKSENGQVTEITLENNPKLYQRIKGEVEMEIEKQEESYLN